MYLQPPAILFLPVVPVKKESVPRLRFVSQEPETCDCSAMNSPSNRL